jgi:hypothetical protein
MSSGNRPRPPSLNLLTSSSPARPISTSASTTHRQSESPFRYVRFHHPHHDVNEKLLDETPLSDLNNNSSSSPHPSCRTSTPPTTSAHRTARSNSPPSAFTAGHRSPLFLRQPVSPHPIRARSLSLSYTYPRGLRLANLVRPWTPIILYAITSIGFLIAIAFWKTEVFTALDELSRWLRRDEDFGHAVLFGLIFLTTFREYHFATCLPKLSNVTTYNSSCSSLFHSYYTIRLYFRSMDRCYPLLFRSSVGCDHRFSPLPRTPP